MRQKNTAFFTLAWLAVALFFMVQITPLWMPKGEGLSFQICTSQGVETITFDENGKPVKTPATPKHDCPFCLAQTSCSITSLATSPLSSDLNHVKSNWERNHIYTKSSQLRNANQTRAPPVFS